MSAITTSTSQMAWMLGISPESVRKAKHPLRKKMDHTAAFRPFLLVTYSENLRPQAEASALVFIKRVFGIGANVRSYGDLAGMVQFNFAAQLHGRIVFQAFPEIVDALVADGWSLRVGIDTGGKLQLLILGKPE